MSTIDIMAAHKNENVQFGYDKIAEDPAYPPPYKQGPSVNMAPYPPQTQAETNLAYQSDHQLAAKDGQTPQPEPNTVVIVRTTQSSEPANDLRSFKAPSSCLGLSIISMIFCCLLGIVATVYSVKSRRETRQGHYRLARDTSLTAVKVASAAYLMGIIKYIIVIILIYDFSRA
ncbi:uncharacterized protein [Amphiura filiformis]|uniref:uncharacterized protein n=1 Tax=Amphiura filiformis TaxID=82378 RepID=UPI003B223744